MKIIIIGAGIGGLSTYLALHKHLTKENVALQIYEAYDIHRLALAAAPGNDDKGNQSSDSLSSQEEVENDPNQDSGAISKTKKDHSMSEESFTIKRVGGAIGLGKNGLAVLSRLDDNGSILSRVQQRGNCVSRWKMGTARGWHLVDASAISSVKNDEIPQSGKNSAAKPDIASMVMISRQACWEVLRDAVVAIDSNAIVIKRVTSIEQGEDGVKVTFSDGNTDLCDLLVGADGLRSAVRRSMFKDSIDKHQQTWAQWLLRQPSQPVDYVSPHYEGLTGVGGYVPGSILAKAKFQPGAMSITFGPNGFFGHGYVGPPRDGSAEGAASALAGWWSTFSSEHPSLYTSQSPDGKNIIFDNDTALKELFARHRNWKDPCIQAILTHIKNTNTTLEHIYPTFTTPQLRHWSRPAAPNSTGSITLLGDAAHALQPSSGQGACQALEDSECLALSLKHYLSDSETSSNSSKAITSALHAYESLRLPRVAKIYTRAQKMSRNKMDMGVVAEFVMYFFIWVASKLGPWDKYNDELFEYDLPAEVERFVRDEGRKK